MSFHPGTMLDHLINHDQSYIIADRINYDNNQLVQILIHLSQGFGLLAIFLSIDEAKSFNRVDPADQQRIQECLKFILQPALQGSSGENFPELLLSHVLEAFWSFTWRTTHLPYLGDLISVCDMVTAHWSSLPRILAVIREPLLMDLYLHQYSCRWLSEGGFRLLGGLTRRNWVSDVARTSLAKMTYNRFRQQVTEGDTAPDCLSLYHGYIHAQADEVLHFCDRISEARTVILRAEK
eukprot:g35508.t1